MMIDWKDIAIALLTIASGLFGWFAKEMWLMIKTLKDDVTELRSDVEKNYVAKSEYREDMYYVRDQLDRILDRLPPKEPR